MDKKSISIKFCGGCNPRIDRGRIASKVSDLLAHSDYTISYNKLDVDFVIYLSGCSANCAVRYSPTEQPHLVVAGSSIDATTVVNGDLAGIIVEEVRAYFESSR